MKNPLIRVLPLRFIAPLAWLLLSQFLTATVEVGFSITDQWATGYNGKITISNRANTAIQGWTLEFDFAGTITNLWNGTVTSQVGTHYVVTSASYNGTIPANGSVDVGFTANPVQANQKPGQYVLNGSSINEGSPSLSMNTSVLGEGMTGVNYQQVMTASGGMPPYVWSIVGGTVPSGLALSNSGEWSGTAQAAATASITIRVTDQSQPVQTVDRGFLLSMKNPPVISISDVSQSLSSSGVAPGFFSTSGNQIIDSTGRPVRITGINWFGFETGNRVFHGLWTRGYKSALDQIRALGFNTLRIPFSNAMLRTGASTTSINFAVNPDLQGLSPLECLDSVIAYCGEIGLRVILDRHSAQADGYLNEDLWYIPGDAYYTEQRWLDDWVMLAVRYLGNPTVIGADLFNEPKRSATWGNLAPATDWNKAAERCANAIHAVNPHWLMIVEGVEQATGKFYWWGGNLTGVASHPVVLNTPNKLVYSIHDYPASVAAQPWFSAADYPQNLGAVWDQYWGYVYRTNVAPILVGEFGSKLLTLTDQLWMDKLTDYMDGDFDLNGVNDLAAQKMGISWTYWCFNPNSGDTGGILNNDWQTVDETKMTAIRASLGPQFDGSVSLPRVTFTVTLSSSAGVSVSVPWSASEGSALPGVHFAVSSGTLVFAPGETSKSISVPLLSASMDDVLRTFRVNLGAPNNGVIGRAAGVAAIAPETPWCRWLTAQFTPSQLDDEGSSLENRDSDSDGLPNLIEYAMGMSPRQPNGDGMTLSRQTGGWELMFQRNRGATDVAIVVESSDDPRGPWQAMANQTVTVIEESSSTQRVKMTLPITTSAPARLYRLRTTKN